MNCFYDVYTLQLRAKILAFIVFIACIFSFSVNGSENSRINISDIKVFAIDESLKYRNGEPANVIDTGVITDNTGIPVRGPHSIVFTLDAGAAFPVVVKGNEVAPGESITLRENLSLVGSRLVLPVFPARAGIEGSAPFTIDLPEIFTEACEEGFTETENDCRAVEYEVLAIDCPAEFVASTENGIECTNYTQAGITLECDDGFEKLSNGMCNKQTVSVAKYNCNDYPGANLKDGMCIQKETFVVSKCKAGWSDYGSSCQRLTNSYNASYACPSGSSWNGSTCVAQRSSTRYLSSRCQPNSIRRGDMCHYLSTASCPSGYTLNGYASVCYDNSIPDDEPKQWVSPICPSGTTYWDLQWCRDISGYEPTKTCTQGTYNSSTGRCETVEYYNRVAQCQFGGNLRGSRCEQYATENHGTYCLSGGEYNANTGSCEIDIQEPAKRYCDAPAVMEPDGASCRITEDYEFQYCEDNTYSPNDDYSLCERTLTEVPVLTCPEGYEVNEEEVRCQKTVVTDFVNS